MKKTCSKHSGVKWSSKPTNILLSDLLREGVIGCSIVCSKEIKKGYIKTEIALRFVQYKTLFVFREKV